MSSPSRETRYYLPAQTAQQLTTESVRQCGNLGLLIDRYLPQRVIQRSKNRGMFKSLWLQEIASTFRSDPEQAEGAYRRWLNITGAAGQRAIEGPLLFVILLCALIAAGMILGVVIAWLSWLLLAVLLVAGLAVIATNWRVVTIPLPLQTFQVQDHAQLIIDNSAGSISIRRGEDKVVTVAAAKRVSGIGMTPENMQVQYALQDNRLNISAHTAWNLLQFGMRYLDLVITVPEGCDIQLRNGSGEITVQGVNGAIDLGTGSGRIDISEVRGQISLKTGSGSVSGTGINGQLKLLTGSGRIELEQAALKGSSQIKTGSGGITFTGELDPYGNYNLLTGSGAVYLTLPSHASFHLNASSGSGGVLNEFGNVEAGIQPSALLRLKSGSGTIHVRRSDR